MKKTKQQIESVMNILNSWGLIDKLTKHEKEVLKIELRNIAGTAIMEAQNTVQNILPHLYHNIIDDTE